MLGFDRKEMGLRLSKKRMAKGLSQEEVAESIGVGRSTYNTIEGGKRALKDDEIPILADLLDTTTDYLLRGVESQNIDICKATGLSDDAASFFHKIDNNPSINFLGYYQTILNCLDVLLSTEKGNNLLHDIGCFLQCDFSQAYIDKSNDGLSFNPLQSGIGFEIVNKTVAGYKTYQFYNPELMEQSAELLLIKKINELKAELQQEKPGPKKRIRKVKK